MAKGLLDMLFPRGGAKFKDDEGLFQGGEQGRPLGRAKDVLGIGTDVEDMMSNVRNMAKNLDVKDSASVVRLQKMMNAAGITDSEGNALAEDGQLGSKTLSALRSVQSGESVDSGGNIVPGSNIGETMESPNADSIGQSYEPIGESVEYSSTEGPNLLDYNEVGAGNQAKTRPTMMRNVPTGNSIAENIKKLFSNIGNAQASPDPLKWRK